ARTIPRSAPPRPLAPPHLTRALTCAPRRGAHAPNPGRQPAHPHTPSQAAPMRRASGRRAGGGGGSGGGGGGSADGGSGGLEDAGVQALGTTPSVLNLADLEAEEIMLDELRAR